MIDDIRKWLLQHQYIKETDCVRSEFRLCGNWSVLCYVNDQLTYFIKIEHFGGIAQEYDTLMFMHSIMPDVVLEPLGLSKFLNSPIYIQRACHHQWLGPKYWQENFDVRQQLASIFMRLSDFKLKNQVMVDERVMAAYGSIIPKGYALKLKQLKLTQRFQHGDFSLNNIGICESQVKLFDWEDYGLSSFPLMDLTVFLMSVNQFDAKAFLLQLESHEFIVWLRNILLHFEISLDHFLYAAPYALMIFGGLKQQLGYGAEVIQKVDLAIRELSPTLLGAKCA